MEEFNDYIFGEGGVLGLRNEPVPFKDLQIQFKARKKRKYQNLVQTFHGEFYTGK